MTRSVQRSYWEDWLGGTIALTLPLVLYLRTLCPTVSCGDSGELCTAAYWLGISHPPGYPLWTLVGRLVSLLPGWDVAGRLGALSAVLSASACLAMWLAVREWLRSREASDCVIVPVALVSALVPLLSPAAWSVSIVAEVYALNLLLTALLLLTLVRWSSTGDGRWVLASGYLWGLALANHPTALLFLPMMVFVWTLGRHQRPRLNHLGEAVFLAGLACTLYGALPLRSAFNPPLDWGDPEGMSGLVAHILRSQYGSHVLSRPLRIWGEQFATALRFPIEELGLPLACLALVGMVVSLRRPQRGMGGALLGGIVAFMVGLIILVNFRLTPAHRAANRLFFLPMLLVLSFWLGGVLAGLVGGVRSRALRRRLGWSLLIIPVALGCSRVKLMDRSQDTLARDFAHAVLRDVDSKSIIFCRGDVQTFPLLYAQAVEGECPTVLLVDFEGLLNQKFYGSNLQRLSPSAKEARRREREAQAFRARERSIYYTFCRKLEHWIEAKMVVDGLVYRAVLQGDPLPSPKEFSLEGLDRGSPAEDYLTRDLRATCLLRRAEGSLDRGDTTAAWSDLLKVKQIAVDNEYVLNDAAILCLNRGAVDQAADFLHQALRVDPSFGDAHHNMGLVHLAIGQPIQAAAAFKRSLEIEPESVESWVNLGVALAWVGRKGEARKAFEKALALDPHTRPARSNLDLLEHNPGSDEGRR